MKKEGTRMLQNVDPDDISDVIRKVEISFAIRFGRTELRDVKHFGELCDRIISKIARNDANDCTSQQAFYKLREAVTGSLKVHKTDIHPDTQLKILFPKACRRKKIQEVERRLGFSLQILRPNHFLSDALAIFLTLSCLTLIVSWKIAFIGISISLVGFLLAKRMGRELEIKNVAELAEKISRENYLKSRRQPETVNRNEIAQKITQLFIQDLGLDPQYLSREAIF